MRELEKIQSFEEKLNKVEIMIQILIDRFDYILSKKENNTSKKLTKN